MSDELKLTDGWLDRNIAAAKSLDIGRLHATIAAKDAEIAVLRERVAEFQASADLRWKSDMRAIKMWQKANPGNDFVCPSQDDLCVWLMDKLTPPKWDDLTQDEKRGVEIICDDVPYHAQIYSEIIALISRRAAAAYGGKE